MNENQYSFGYQRLVAFKDTDMAGVVHFTQLLAYVEEAEHSAMSSVGVVPISGAGGFPKVHVECDYSSPARFGDRVEVKLVIKRLSRSSAHWAFAILSEDEKKICDGRFVTVFVDHKGETECLQDDSRSRLETLVITESP